MINQVVLVGRLTKDPELKYTPSGVAVANFTMAMSKVFYDEQRNKQEKTAFINCVVWRKAAENVANYKKKGELIGVTGSLDSRTYDDPNGRKVFVTEVAVDDIQYMPSGGSQGSQNSNQSNYNNNNQGYQQNNNQGNYQNNQPNYNNNNQRNYNDQRDNRNQPDPFAGSRPIDISDDDLPF